MITLKIDSQNYDSEWVESEPSGYGTPILWMPRKTGDGSPYQYGRKILYPTDEEKAEAKRRWDAYYASTTPEERWLCRKNSVLH
jgi:hypothetical protein